MAISVVYEYHNKSVKILQVRQVPRLEVNLVLNWEHKFNGKGHRKRIKHVVRQECVYLSRLYGMSGKTAS